MKKMFQLELQLTSIISIIVILGNSLAMALIIITNVEPLVRLLILILILMLILLVLVLLRVLIAISQLLITLSTKEILPEGSSHTAAVIIIVSSIILIFHMFCRHRRRRLGRFSFSFSLFTFLFYSNYRCCCCYLRYNYLIKMIMTNLRRSSSKTIISNLLKFRSFDNCSCDTERRYNVFKPTKMTFLKPKFKWKSYDKLLTIAMLLLTTISTAMCSTSLLSSNNSVVNTRTAPDNGPYRNDRRIVPLLLEHHRHNQVPFHNLTVPGTGLVPVALSYLFAIAPSQHYNSNHNHQNKVSIQLDQYPTLSSSSTSSYSKPSISIFDNRRSSSPKIFTAVSVASASSVDSLLDSNSINLPKVAFDSSPSSLDSGLQVRPQQPTTSKISKRRGRRKRSSNAAAGAAPSTITIKVPSVIGQQLPHDNCLETSSLTSSTTLSNQTKSSALVAPQSAYRPHYRRLFERPHRPQRFRGSTTNQSLPSSLYQLSSTNVNVNKVLYKRMATDGGGSSSSFSQRTSPFPPLLPRPEMLHSPTPTPLSSTELAQRKNQEKDFEIIGTLTGVAGGKIALPCNITPVLPNDAVSLILWYKDESTTPIYSVDARKGVSLDAARRVTDENLASRSYMNTMTRPYAHMMLELLTIEDAGEYACRVDFRKERTRNSVIFLKIIIPPDKPQIKDAAGETQASLIGPYTEGDRLALVCEVEGGKPVPSVTWWRESVLLDDSYEAITSSATISSPMSIDPAAAAASSSSSSAAAASGTITIVRNELVINALQRHDLMAVFTCQASNNNISLPTTTTVTVDLNFRPVGVKIVDLQKPLSSDKLSILTCSSSGSRPPATITWWLGSAKLKRSEEQISVDGNSTTSRLTITPTIDDIGKKVTCRAENQQIPGSAIEDSIKLDINFVPQITLRLGSNLRHSHIQEGNDVYFECVIRASPWVTEIRWHFEGRELQTNTSAGVIVSNQSLVLQKVRRNHRGKYTCSATNAEGEGESNAIHLRVQFAPICKPGQKILYGAARQETVSVLCEVESDPAEVNFHWSYNGTGTTNGEPKSNTGNSQLNFESSGSLSSVAHYTPLTEFDYGTIYCWAHNSVGVQTAPCAYSIVAAGSPDSVHNCSVLNVTEDSMRVECLEGYDGGLLQHFVLECYDTTSERSSTLRANLSSPTASFNMNRLQPAHSYLLLIYSANAKGRSKGLALTAFTLAMPESMNRLAKGNVWQLNFNPVLIVLIAIVTGVVLVAFFIVAIVRWRTTKPSMINRYQREKGPGPNNKPDSMSSKSPEHQSSGINNNNNHNQQNHAQHFSAVFRKGGSLVEEICDVCTTCTPGESDDTENCTIKTKSTDLGPDISLTSSSEGTNSKSAGLDDYGSHHPGPQGQSPNYHQTVDPNDEKLTSLLSGEHPNRQQQSGQQQSGHCPNSAMSLTGSNGSSNIYTSTPLSSSNGSTVAGAVPTNKHVTWRPETPPSPPPNIYTQYSAYVPVQSSSYCEDPSSLMLGSMGLSAAATSSATTSSYPSPFDGLLMASHSPYAAAYHSQNLHSPHNPQHHLQNPHNPLHHHAHNPMSQSQHQPQQQHQQSLPMSYTISTGLSGHHHQPASGLLNGSQSNYMLGSHQFPYGTISGANLGLLLNSSINPYQQQQHQPHPTSQSPQPQPLLQNHQSGYSTLQHPRRVRILPVSSASPSVQSGSLSPHAAPSIYQLAQKQHQQQQQQQNFSQQQQSSPSTITTSSNNGDELNRSSPMTEV